MFNAQYLFLFGHVYSPWMERQGDNIIITADAVEISGLTLRVRVFTKNSQDPGPRTHVGTLGTTDRLMVATEGRASMEFGGELKELVRYECRAVQGTERTDYALFRMLNPVWFDSVRAAPTL